MEQRSGVAAGGTQRIDKWLWFARVVKSRTSAAGLVTSGKVRVNRARIDKPAHTLKTGDVVTVTVARRVRILKMIAPGHRRGPAAEAQTLYEDLSPRLTPTAANSPRADGVTRDPGAGRPTKRDRRQIDNLRQRGR
ncbi:MAG: RNA-binding S4 domain-containing protein [Hyphomicrobiaceae bacterium]|nr:RNA-binding S4 domain-containing protein [Hyphomicrobiaceae bacterium]